MANSIASSPTPVPVTTSVGPQASKPDTVSSTTTPQIVINIPGPAPAEKGAADILNGIAALLWPLLIALVLILFRTQIVSLARRIRKGKAFGAEAEFGEELEALNREAKKASEEAQAGSSPEEPGDETEEINSSASEDIRTMVLAEAARSPRIGLMWLSAEIDKLARRIAAATGHQQRSSVREQIQLWSSVLPTHASAAYRLFSHVRNRIVHGGTASEPEILSAIDSGLELYSALASISLEKNVVAHPGVDIFSDPEATQLLEGKGVIIETTHEGKKTTRIYPSTLTHFKPGMRLTWEWNMGRMWQAAWYRDPQSSDIKEAWRSSAEFIGKDLDQI